jgi:phosphoadenosine phosphosulfate reductase
VEKGEGKMKRVEPEFTGYGGSEEPEEVLRWAVETFHPALALSASFEHTVLLHMLTAIRPDIRVFSLDTGRLPEETFRCAAEAERQFGVRVEWYFPATAPVEKLVREGGVYGFRESLEARRECCRVRKVEPLARALGGLRAWVTGLRRDEASTRSNLAVVEVDEAHGGIMKINPLAAWTDKQVRDYTIRHRLPYNSLYDRGYLSIGCECCTRAVGPGGNLRDGRWWWENPEHKECGLHVK